MGYREVTMLEVKEVLRQWLSGAGKKTIAARLALDVKTVRRYLRAAEDCGLQPGPGPIDEVQRAQVVARLQTLAGRPHRDSWELCEREHDFIAQQLAGRVRLSKVHRLLARRGVLVPYPTLHRFAVAELEFGRTSPTIPVADCEPGQEIQLDTGWMTLLEPDLFGKRRRFRAWIFTAVLSRHRFVFPCFEESTRTAIAACEAAWEFYGGIFHVIIPDYVPRHVIGVLWPSALCGSRRRGPLVFPALAASRPVTRPHNGVLALDDLLAACRAARRLSCWIATSSAPPRSTGSGLRGSDH